MYSSPSFNSYQPMINRFHLYPTYYHPLKSLNIQTSIQIFLIVLDHLTVLLNHDPVKSHILQLALRSLFKNLWVLSHQLYSPCNLFVSRNLKFLLVLIIPRRGDLTCSSVLCISCKLLVKSNACWTFWQRGTLFW